LDIGCDIPASVDESDGVQTRALWVLGENLFRRGVELRFAVGRRAQYETTHLSVFDIGGREVRRLVDDRLPDGLYQSRWDGRDDHGRPCPSGIYYCRLGSGEVKESSTVVLVR